jgi:hypothetical protein
MSPMEILALLDELDDIVHNAKPVPLTDQVRIDKDRVYAILDRMREVFPDTVRRMREPDEVDRAAEPAPESVRAPTVIDVDEAARTLTQLLERVKFAGESFRLEAHGMPMAELRRLP